MHRAEKIEVRPDAGWDAPGQSSTWMREAAAVEELETIELEADESHGPLQDLVVQSSPKRSPERAPEKELNEFYSPELQDS